MEMASFWTKAQSSVLFYHSSFVVQMVILAEYETYEFHKCKDLAIAVGRIPFKG